jgi:integrase
MHPMGTHGQGSGPTQRADGRWQVSVTMPGGKRIFRYRPTSRQAEAELRKLVRMREADIDPAAQTLAAFLREWIAGLRDATHRRVRPRTLEHYAMIVERHIIPGFGERLTLQQLTRRKIQAWINADRSSARTTRHHHAVLRRALNTAVGDLIERNPALGVELPDADFEGHPLTIDEARALLAASAGSRFAALWWLAIDTGWRQGELLGLARDDVDLDAGTVGLESQLQRIDGEWVLGEPKAARTLDRVSLAPQTVDVLRRHLLTTAAERTPEWRYFGLVFVKPNGQPYHARDVLRAFHDACDAAGIARRRFHDLRGSSATLHRAIGTPEDVRMARMGHSTTQMARHYGRATVGIDREAADRLGEALR